MDLKLNGKVALVTGSSRGIGKAIAAALASEGCHVIVNGRDADVLDGVAAELKAAAVAGDVSTRAGADAVLERAVAIHGRVDIVVCNVGSGASVPPGQEDEAEWLRMLQINLMSATNTVAAARPHLGAQGGAILCISSICGSAALGAPVAYSAAKAALDSFVRGAARYLAPENIRINALAPGNILFEGSTWERKLAADADAVATMLKREVAMARLGTAEEVASMAAFLCSAKASFATGALFVLDGGQLRG
ncbi:oxidoreductase [Burkholderia ubonensis]|uniref:SDR family NAD(P)-dependent oxidoreductase n=1 Tax=Burkholderia ubonensis TaxID=101571 RepID=UPI00075B4E28|nr:SDR family oxidoreductase [Burkholderia ubonensis]KVN58774.1 oxidoreductase [Burkholderia ubonensis]KVR34919.1 oxidoreductase [Burkholderia ubonensis]KVT51572.1 oxidoreductase [Burkholderia ubonensis]KWI10063.1 oxidoreductase [Burkholderia ubonensis]KWI30765.1 oxidoreductase [Burkholderia ubonensis]